MPISCCKRCSFLCIVWAFRKDGSYTIFPSPLRSKGAGRKGGEKSPDTNMNWWTEELRPKKHVHLCQDLFSCPVVFYKVEQSSAIKFSSFMNLKYLAKPKISGNGFAIKNWATSPNSRQFWKLPSLYRSETRGLSEGKILSWAHIDRSLWGPIPAGLGNNTAVWWLFNYFNCVITCIRCHEIPRDTMPNVLYMDGMSWSYALYKLGDLIASQDR